MSIISKKGKKRVKRGRKGKRKDTSCNCSNLRRGQSFFFGGGGQSDYFIYLSIYLNGSIVDLQYCVKVIQIYTFFSDYFPLQVITNNL